MFTSSVSLFVTHVLFFFILLFPWILLVKRGIYVLSCLFFLLGGPIILRSGKKKLTAMIMLTSSQDGCQSSITFARMNVMAGSLYEENTSVEEVCCTNCSATICQHVGTLNAPYTHMWRTRAYVDWVTSCQYRPSLSFAIGQAAISPPPSAQIKYNIKQISLSRTLLALPSLP
jgi:hypothetical protein